MRSLGGVGLGLSLVFGCLLLALIAELYYLLWWKKRINNRDIEDDYSSPSREFLYMFCWKKPSSLSSTALNPQQLGSSFRITETHDSQSHPNKDLWFRPFGEESLEDELMRLQNLSGPPRLLFTIKEETEKDLELELGLGSGRSVLGDLVLNVETPFLTPLASPSYFSPMECSTSSLIGQNHGFNPLFECSTDAEFNRIRSSPPPKFKFLRDAEDKLYKKHNIQFEGEEKEGSFITLIVDNNKKPISH